MLSNEEIEELNAHTNALESARKCDELAGNENFQWFLETVLAPLVKREESAALDVTKTPEVRDQHAHRAVMAREVAAVFPKTRTFWANKVKAWEKE